MESHHSLEEFGGHLDWVGLPETLGGNLQDLRSQVDVAFGVGGSDCQSPGEVVFELLEGLVEYVQVPFDVLQHLVKALELLATRVEIFEVEVGGPEDLVDLLADVQELEVRLAVGALLQATQLPLQVQLFLIDLQELALHLFVDPFRLDLVFQKPPILDFQEIPEIFVVEDLLEPPEVRLVLSDFLVVPLVDLLDPPLVLPILFTPRNGPR